MDEFKLTYRHRALIGFAYYVGVAVGIGATLAVIRIYG